MNPDDLFLSSEGWTTLASIIELSDANEIEPAKEGEENEKYIPLQTTRSI